mmetsp:Transcript_96685/g.282623  ORF Transcript_96685/g.282623 Transcript_96685/m.282623 type:complete len:252 (-) Transcript_96685:527-1282(-)
MVPTSAMSCFLSPYDNVYLEVWMCSRFLVPTPRASAQPATASSIAGTLYPERRQLLTLLVLAIHRGEFAGNASSSASAGSRNLCACWRTCLDARAGHRSLVVSTLASRQVQAQAFLQLVCRLPVGLPLELSHLGFPFQLALLRLPLQRALLHLQLLLPFDLFLPALELHLTLPCHHILCNATLPFELLQLLCCNQCLVALLLQLRLQEAPPFAHFVLLLLSLPDSLLRQLLLVRLALPRLLQELAMHRLLC